MSRLPFLSRATFTNITAPVAKVLLRAGLTPNVVTVIGTAGAATGALTLFPTGRLFAGAVAVWFFALFDMLDGAMARQRGGGSSFGAVLDATCDRIGDGAVFCGLAWWTAFGMHSKPLTAATLICLVTSQVISYIKARAEAGGLRGDGGLIERPERLIIVLTGAGLSDFPGLSLPWALPVAMWLLALASLITCAQRLHTVRTSSATTDPVRPVADRREDKGPQS